MASLKHYHLGGGEALHSAFDSLRQREALLRKAQHHKRNHPALPGSKGKKH